MWVNTLGRYRNNFAVLAGNLATNATILQSEVRNTAHKHAIHPTMSTPQPSITEFACQYHLRVLAERICDL